MRRDVFKNLERRLNQAQAKNRLLTERLIAHGERVLDEGADEEVDERLGSDALPQPSAAPVSPHAVQDQHDRRNDDVANEVSYLSTNVGGDRQFLGSASGLLFASLVRESIVSPQDGQISSSASLSDRPGYNVPGQRPNWGIDDSDLPPPELAKSLIEAYLAHDHLCFPILAPSFVRAIVSSIYQHRPSHGIHDPFESYVFNMVLAIATSQIHKYNWQALPDAETHHLRAMVHLDRVLREGGLKALQALLLLCHFKLSSSTKDTSGSMSGNVFRLQDDIDLHFWSRFVACSWNRGTNLF